MKKTIFIAALSVALVGRAQSVYTPAIARDAELEKKVEATLARMTLEEKIGQMTQLNWDQIGRYDERLGPVVDDAKLDKIIGQYKVGSILNTPTPAPGPKKWNEYLTKIQKKSMDTMGIPCIYGLDENHGSTYVMGGTLFPQNINVGASFDPDMARRCAEATAYETRAASTSWTFSPTMDLSRNPAWPRVWENYGEDCLVNAIMGTAQTLGFQGDDPNHIDQQHVAVSLKHYMGYGGTVSGKDRTPAIIAPQDLREKHFAPYLMAISNGALAVMANSGSVNYVPVHSSHELLTTWLKDDLQWDGVIITDWADINNLYTREMVAANKKEAICTAINAGIDMAMEPYSVDYCDLLKELVNEGRVSMERIDDATRRVLRMKYRLGLFENPVQNPKKYPKFGGKEFADLALKAAEESIILLKNEGYANGAVTKDAEAILPLKAGQKILVTGPNANQMRCLNGGWSYTWQGSGIEEFAKDYNTIYEAMQKKFGTENVVLEQGVTYKDKGAYYEENEPEIEKAVKAAKDVDIILACIGENSYTETPGNLNDLTLSHNQLDLVKALAKTGKPVVLILNEGRARIINDIEPLASAIVDILLPGNYGADALANLLAGDANFCGKLPITYPRYVNSLNTYDYRRSEVVSTMAGAYNYEADVTVQWPFGYGKSYTTFEYSNLQVDRTEFNAEHDLTFTVDIKNTGDVDGKESVLLFSSDLLASVVPECRRLRAFTKVEVKAGETKTVTLTIPASDLAFVGTDGRWILEAGDFNFQIGNQVIGANCYSTFIWANPNK